MDDIRKQITDWYNQLCAMKRKNERERSEAVCNHCARPRKDHHYEEERCTLYVTSLFFRASNQTDVDRVNKTIEAVEHLAMVQGWALA